MKTLKRLLISVTCTVVMLGVISIAKAEVIYRRYSDVGTIYISSTYLNYQAQADFVDNVYRNNGKMLNRGGGATMSNKNVVNYSTWVRVWAYASGPNSYDNLIYRDVSNTSSVNP